MTRKPDTRTAMNGLIHQVREAMPFDASKAAVCADDCNGCSKKLLEFIAMELDDWEARLNNGHLPTLGDVERLARTCKKVYRVLERNGLIED